MRQIINGGNHTHNYNLTQQELNFESKITISFRGSPKLKEFIDKRAKAMGTTTSALIESTIIKQFRTEQAIKKVHAELDEILTQNFL